ncbi:MAG: hypothetical protein GY866_09975 [Proteobacteria bacterium]|nr:hypothetical protein [Pseudomonadota bacterium]
MSREEILDSIRENRPEPVDLPDPDPMPPDPDGVPKDTDDSLRLFLDRLTAAGGEGVVLNDENELAGKIRELFPDVANVFTNVPALASVYAVRESVQSPQGYESTDLAILKGEFAVAENGAVWITDDDLDYRSVCFLTQHLALVVGKENIVADMIRAYQTISLPLPGFGCFVSGPSKTADIEQALVIGAHGARTTTVFLV